MMQSKSYFRNRLAKFRRHFSHFGVEGFVIENPTDLSYFTGLSLSQGRLLIGPKTATLFVDGRYLESALKEAPYPVMDYTHKALQERLASLKGVTCFGFDTALSVAAYKELKGVFKQRTLRGIEAPTFTVRALKDRWESAHLKESAALLWKGFLYARKKLKVGLRECDLACAFECYVKKQGAEGVSFSPIIAFGENTSFPHHHSGTRRLKKGDIVLLDLGVVVNGYASDMTRVVFFGQVPGVLQEIYTLVRKAHGAAVALCREGTPVGALDQAAREAMGDHAVHFIHSLGHGIGLNVHETPRISKQSKPEVSLKAGMVVTIEPGIYLPGVGGVRYEDMLIITKRGHDNLFQPTPP